MLEAIFGGFFLGIAAFVIFIILIFKCAKHGFEIDELQKQVKELETEIKILKDRTNRD